MRTRVPFLVILAAFGLSGRAEDEATQAREVWERAIQAKGGRELLHSVRSVLTNHTTVFNYLTLRPSRCPGRMLMVPPYRLWFWEDERPAKPFDLYAQWIDLKTNQSQLTYAEENKPEDSRTGVIPQVGLVRGAILLTLMEVDGLRPEPLRTWKTWDGLVPETVVETRVVDQIYEWHLHHGTFLPRRVVIKMIKGIDFHDGEYRLGDYRLVDGMQLPHRIDWRHLRKQIEYKINVDYDEEIFRRPPSPAAGPDAWMKKQPPQLRERQ